MGSGSYAASPDGINVYLVEDVLIDATTRRAGKRILGQLKVTVNAHALAPRPSRPSGRIGRGLRQAAHSVLGGCGRRRTGGCRAIMREPGSASAEPARDALLGRPGPQRRPRAARRRRRGGFPRDRRTGPLTRARGLLARGGPGADHRRRAQRDQRGHRPARHRRAEKAYFTADPAENRRSARKLAQLGRARLLRHGPPLRDPRRFVEFVEGLPA